MIGVQRLPLIEQKTLDEWGTVSSPAGRLCRWTTRKKQNQSSLMIGVQRLALIEQKTLDEWGTVSSSVGWLCRWTTRKKQNQSSLMIDVQRLALIEQKTLDEWGTVSSPAGWLCRWTTDKKQGRPFCESAGEDALTTADLEISATVSSPVGRQRRWETSTRGGLSTRRNGFAWRIWLAVALLFLSGSAAMWAHIGPPYPIMQDRKIGPLTVEVWSNPDVGTGSFFIVIDAPKGGSVPSDMKVQVSVQPVSGRLPVKTYDAWRDRLRDRVEFKAEAPFDKEETWKVEVALSSKEISGETGTNVEVTPALLGRWDLLLFLLPFLGVGFLWFKAVTTKRRNRRLQEMRSAKLG